MAERLNNFDLKLLTASKEVGLRRLRSYSASLGGGAQIFNTFDDVRRNLETCFQGRRLNIVLHDDTIPLTAAQLGELSKYARVFVLQKPDPQRHGLVPKATSPCWGMESYMQCSLGAFLDSPVIRMSMAQMCKTSQPFHLEHLLRWGHAASKWSAREKSSVADASQSFVRSLNLGGEGRRLTEMFSHFLQARLPDLGLRKDAVTFGSDGLLITVIAHCTPEPGMQIRDVAEELRIHDFPISVINRLDGGGVEIAALYYPFQLPAIHDERIVMVFNKIVDETAEAALPAATPKAS
jgi:hypothetical protein